MTIREMWAATLFLWPVLSWAGPAEQFLSEDFFPGFHILEKLEESPIYQVYDRGQRLTDPPQLDWSKAKDLAEAQERLESLLKIPPREEMQLPCAFFTPDGERIEALQGLLRSPVLFFLENGQWMWPAVRIGFQQNVTGLPDVYLTTLSLRPAVFEVRNFMSSQEADEVMAIGAQQGLHSLAFASKVKMYTAGTAISEGQMQSNDLKKGTSHASFRTSKQAWLSNDLAPIIARLDERTAQVTRIPAEHNEPVQLLRYDTGTYYHAHMDWTELDFYPDQRHIWMDSHFGHFDRLATLFWYLNDVQEGGETIFPKHGQPICAPRSLGGPAARFCTGARDPDMSSCVKGLKVRPRKGTAVLWYNFLATGRGDRNSLHAGCPVGPNETKWSGNKWVRNKPWGTPGHWMPGHPALKRYGWRADDEEPSCHIAFQSHSDQPAALLWLDGKKAMELAKIPPHGSIAQLSYDGHRFQIRVGEHSSRPVSCRAPSSDFVITKSLDLVPITENQEL